MYRKIAVSTILLLTLWAGGCSSMAYVQGYNLVAEPDIELLLEKEKEEPTGPGYSGTAYTIAMVETGGGYLRKSPTLIIGVAMAPVFFIVGTFSGAFDPGPQEAPTAPEAPAAQEEGREVALLQNPRPR